MLMHNDYMKNEQYIDCGAQYLNRTTVAADTFIGVT
jgi:hypothetical protein